MTTTEGAYTNFAEVTAALEKAGQIDIFCRSARSREHIEAVSGKLRGLSSARIVLYPFEDRDALREAAINGLNRTVIQQTLQEILSKGNMIEIVMKPANTAENE